MEHPQEQGDGSFKDATFTAAAEHLKAFHVTGKIKDGMSLKNKWSTLKRTFTLIETYQNHKSGFHWDNQNGANIHGTAAESVFKTYVDQLPSNGLMREFCNTGSQYYDHFVQILPTGASSSVRTHRGTGRKTAMTANSTDSPDSQSLATASSAPPYC
ncbi:hypothetical protein OG21DRAFT_1485742 [Imleria badia]|nr:hypothetical protein OG21DRAFT_1485742 [Imleria badia]